MVLNMESLDWESSALTTRPLLHIQAILIKPPPVCNKQILMVPKVVVIPFQVYIEDVIALARDFYNWIGTPIVSL